MEIHACLVCADQMCVMCRLEYVRTEKELAVALGKLAHALALLFNRPSHSEYCINRTECHNVE